MAEQAKTPLPSPSIESMFYMLATSALVNLGEVPNPVDNKQSVDLEMARHNIDTLSMLGEKTKGNLTPSEEQLLAGLLNELRLKFVAKSSSKQ
jgi:hypothetical protein